MCIRDRHYYIYPKIYLAEKNRIVTTLSSSRAQKRVNSCIVYINADVNEHNYGLVQKLVMLDTHTFAIIICLKKAAQQLYNNRITKTNFDEHFIAFLPPRPNDLVLIPACNIQDKCIYLDVHSIHGHVFASQFPNTMEMELSLIHISEPTRPY